MTAYVVDTNVALTANGLATQASLQCQSDCINRLKKIVQRGIVVIDDGGRILAEYRGRLKQSGQPGVGDAFFRHVFQNQANPAKCERVSITPRQDDQWDFEEFPRDPDLALFDIDDRKFVAVALASVLHPRIQNATDTDWWQARDALNRHGIRIDFLCPELMWNAD